MHNGKNKLYIVLEIGDFRDCVRVRCISLKSVLYAYQFTATSYIESMLTSGFCPSYLSIKWPTFNATHIAKNQSLPFPPKILISPWKRRRIRKILLNQDFYVLPLVEYNQNFRLLDLSTDETPRDRSVIVNVAETSLNDQPTRSDQAVAVPVPLRGFPSTTGLSMS